MIFSPNIGSQVSLFASHTTTLGWFALSRTHSEYSWIISSASNFTWFSGPCQFCPVHTKYSFSISSPASSAMSSHLSGTGPMQKRKLFQFICFGISLRSLRTHCSSQGSVPDFGSSKKRCSVMFDPRIKYTRPFKYARFGGVSKRNSRIPNRVLALSPPVLVSSTYRFGSSGHQSFALGIRKVCVIVRSSPGCIDIVCRWELAITEADFQAWTLWLSVKAEAAWP